MKAKIIKAKNIKEEKHNIHTQYSVEVVTEYSFNDGTVVKEKGKMYFTLYATAQNFIDEIKEKNKKTKKRNK